ncbi:putative RNA-directed DNA polymerase [Tanacetum coccineum]
MSNSNTNLQTQSSNALHNAIMEAGSKDRPPMLAPGNYVQWKSRIKRYIDTKSNSELIYYCLQNPPYTYQWAEKTVPVAEGIDNNITPQLLLVRNACEMWKAIERLKQGESINVQDLETNLYWEFGKFTSRDGESLESYYSRFYKMMNELVRNQCHVTNHQVNVQFLLQLQPEWQRFVTLVKQSQELKTVSYHKLYDILKQHQNEVNEIRTERLARTANPLALVAQQQPVYHHQNHPTQNTQYSSTRSQQSTRNRGKAIVTSSAPTYDPEPATVTEDEEMSKEKEIDKLMALISLSFKKIYKPTNKQTLRNSSNTVDAYKYNSQESTEELRMSENRTRMEAHINVHGHNFKRLLQIQLTNSGPIFDDEPIAISFAKPEFLKKAQRANPRLYDIGCYNDNLALMLAPESDESIQLANKCRSKLSDLIRPFDYDQLNNLYDWVSTVSNTPLFSNSFAAQKFLGTVKFGNDQIAPILGYGDLVQGTITIKRGNDLLIGMVMAIVVLSHLNLNINLLSKNNIVTGLPKLDGENLDKMKEKGDACIFVGYSTQSRAYRVFNKRTRVIVETIHVNFDELPQMASDHVSSDPVPQWPTNCTRTRGDHRLVMLIRAIHVYFLFNIHPSDTTLEYDHPLDKSLGNPSQLVRTDEELHQFDRLDAMGISSTDHFEKMDMLKRRKHIWSQIKLQERGVDELSNFMVSEGIHQIGGDKLVSWSSKKQDCTSMSSAEAEYVSLSTCCVQVLWLRTQLTDYGFHFDKIPMYCDSKAAITISCNPVQYSRMKHIDVRYHFIKEQVEKGIVELFFVGTEYQLADLFTKALSEDRFKYLVRRLGMRCLTPDELEVLAIESA